MTDYFYDIFTILLLLTLLFSFYIFIRALFFNDSSKRRIFSTWQFPMLLALYIDQIYVIKL
jgi:hypothetical protein